MELNYKHDFLTPGHFCPAILNIFCRTNFHILINQSFCSPSRILALISFNFSCISTVKSDAVSVLEVEKNSTWFVLGRCYWRVLRKVIEFSENPVLVPTPQTGSFHSGLPCNCWPKHRKFWCASALWFCQNPSQSAESLAMDLAATF